MYAWLGFLTVACLVPVQVYANKMNAIASPAHNRNSRLTVWNWLIVVPGAIWLLLAVLGTYLESTGQL
jgi:hypothetical protein